MKKILPMITLCLMAISMSAVAESTAIPQGYVDLGLPSGTLWKTKNEVREEFPNRNAYWYNSTAAKEFGNQLPTVEQLDELRNACQWIWMGNGYKVVGPNGESIFLPAAGYEPAYYGSYSSPSMVGSIGYYCSSSESIIEVKDEDREYEDLAEYSLFFISDTMVIDTTIGIDTWIQHSVRLVKSAAPRYVDLGLRSGTLWKGQNEDGFYTYADAKAKFGMRVPTEAQFEELRSACRWEWTGIQYKITGPNNQCIFLPAPGSHINDKSIIRKGIRGDYGSSTSHDSNQSYLWLHSQKTQMAKLPDYCKMSIRLVKPVAEVPRGYIDLGLPSGTVWMSHNEPGFYNYIQASYKSSLPTKKQFRELLDLCEWTWTGRGYTVTSPSGASIYLPASGVRNHAGIVRKVGTYGRYWTSDDYGPGELCYLYYNNSYTYFIDFSHDGSRYGGFSIRKVTSVGPRYVDLGLPSGTLWKSQNEDGLYTHDEAVTKFGNQLPTLKQYEELRTACRWVRDNNRGFIVIGPNGNYIHLPAVGYRDCDDKYKDLITIFGSMYWLRESLSDDSAYVLHFDGVGYEINNTNDRCDEISVRLVR